MRSEFTEHTVSFPSKAKRVVAGTLAILCALAFGILQSVDIVTLILYLRSNPNLRHLLRSCLTVNAVLFVSLWSTSFLFAPLWAIGSWGQRHPGNQSDKPQSDTRDGGGDRLDLLQNVWFSVFSVMWVVPMYGITQALGVRWYSALYAEAYSEKRRRAASTTSPDEELKTGGDEMGTPRGSALENGPLPPQSLHGVVTSISELLFKTLVTAVYAVAVLLLEIFVPTALGGHFIGYMMNSWLYAFYVFDYRLSSQYIYDRRTRRQARITLSAALKLFERHWAYFLGFGSTHFIITGALRASWIASSWFSIAAVTSVLFGAHVVLSVEATPNPRAPFSVPIFTPFFALCGRVLGIIAKAMQ